MAKTKAKPSNRKGGSKKTVCKNGNIKKKVPKLFTFFKCDECNKEFTDKGNLTYHKKLHTNSTPFKCTLCPYQGKTKKYVSRHMKRHQKLTDKHKCETCGRRFLYECNLKVHAMVHTGEKPHKCKVCGKAFRVTYSLNSHMLIHKDAKPFECSFCEYACRDSSTLRKHQNKHMGLEQKYECKICNKKYVSLAALKIHISERHLDIDMHRFPCDKCGKSFKTKAHMRFHVTSVHERSLVCDCPICGRRIANKNNLPSHMRTHLDERPFSCTFPGCGVAFKDKNTLTKHKPIHDPLLRCACRRCGRTFARKSHLKRHEMVMHGSRRRCVECDYCGSRFYSKNYLTKHIQTKHVLKNMFKYICDHCGLLTYNKPSIVMHLKYGHLHDDDVTCNICSAKFAKHMNLKAHYWRSHNIKYKLTRKGYAKKKKDKKASVEIKVEPVDAESFEDVKFLDIIKQEEVEDENLDYSKQVLCEDIAQTRTSKPAAEEVEFEEFYLRHVFVKPETTQAVPVTKGVDDEKNELVKKRIKKILLRTQKLEKAKKRQLEKKQQREKEIAEAKAKEERAGQEIFELKRVREMYNERMRAFAKKKYKKDAVTIKYFKKKPGEPNETGNEDDSQNSMDGLESDGNLPLNAEVNKETNNEIDTLANVETCDDNIVSHENELNGSTLKTNIALSENDMKDATDDSIPGKEDNAIENSVPDNNPINGKSVINDNESTENNDIPSSDKNVGSSNNDLSIDSLNDDCDDILNQPLKKRLRNRNKKKVDDKADKTTSDNEHSEEKTDDDKSWKGSDDENNDIETRKVNRIEFKTHQCYICFKLFQTKPELIKHCQEHFDVCNDRTLTKCPMCKHVSYKSLAEHMKKVHKLTFKIPVFQLKDRKNEEGSRYCYDVNGTIVEVIPSVKILNKHASAEIERKKREQTDKSIVKSKLVKKGDSWIVEKEAIDVKFDEIAEFDDKVLATCKVSDDDVDRLGQLNYLAKKKGLKIMFPCFKCDKICQGFSALKLHKRRHEANPAPFRPRQKKPRYEPRYEPRIQEKKNVDKRNRTALPKPIVNKHKCDAKLKEFYKNNIRGSDIEFWQFLKIFNRMDREKVNDFKDLECRTDFGIHWKVANDETVGQNCEEPKDDCDDDLQVIGDEMDSDIDMEDM